jgi:hypothetical protein
LPVNEIHSITKIDKYFKYDVNKIIKIDEKFFWEVYERIHLVNTIYMAKLDQVQSFPHYLFNDSTDISINSAKRLDK